MLEALIAALIKKEDLRDVTVESAGTYIGVDPSLVGSLATEHAVTCMEARGLDISGHHSQRIADIAIHNYDLIVCMTKEEAAYVLNLEPRGMILLANAMRDIPNPWQKGIEEYEVCAKVLEEVAAEIVCKYVI